MSESETSPILNDSNEENKTPEYGLCQDGQTKKSDAEGTNCSDHFLQRLIAFFKKEEQSKEEEEKSKEREEESKEEEEESKEEEKESEEEEEESEEEKSEEDEEDSEEEKSEEDSKEEEYMKLKTAGGLW